MYSNRVLLCCVVLHRVMLCCVLQCKYILYDALRNYCMSYGRSVKMDHLEHSISFALFFF